MREPCVRFLIVDSVVECCFYLVSFFIEIVLLPLGCRIIIWCKRLLVLLMLIAGV